MLDLDRLDLGEIATALRDQTIGAILNVGADRDTFSAGIRSCCRHGRPSVLPEPNAALFSGC